MDHFDCEEVRERLPWLVRGSLAADERAAVDAHLASCPACRAELADTRRARWIASRHLPAELLADYGAGLELGDWPRELVESHLASCAECAADLAGDVRDGTTQARSAVSVAERPAAQPRSGRSVARRNWALAASLLAALAVGWLGGRVGRSPLPAIEASVALLQVEPESARRRGTDESPAEFDAEVATTIVLTTDRVLEPTPYRLRVFAADGRVVARIEPLASSPDGTFVLHLQPRVWPPGELRLELESRAGAAWAPIETYTLHPAR